MSTFCFLNMSSVVYWRGKTLCGRHLPRVPGSPLSPELGTASVFVLHTPLLWLVTRLDPLSMAGSLTWSLESVTRKVQAFEVTSSNHKRKCHQRNVEMCLSFFCILKPQQGHRKRVLLSCLWRRWRAAIAESLRSHLSISMKPLGQ